MGIETKRYVVGFMIDDFGESPTVLLIRKQRPEWQRGKLNGVGGKIEPGEEPLAAMVREFEEETAIKTHPLAWRHFVTLRGAEVYVPETGGRFAIYFYVGRMPTGRVWNLPAIAPTDEVPVEVPVRDLWSHPVVPNLLWLVPMAMSLIMRDSNQRAPGFDVTEWEK